MDVTTPMVNGIDTDALRRLAGEIAEDPDRGRASFHVTTSWKGGTRSDTRVESWQLGGRAITKDFTLRADEPCELLGCGTAPNPQEMLLAAFNACLTVGYVAGCSLEGIRVRSLRIECDGMLDLRGFLGLSPDASPGYQALRLVVHLDADGTPEKLQAIHDRVMRTSPNRWSLAQPVPMEATLLLTGSGSGA
jgi:uncharacterized OsmC-like protein